MEISFIILILGFILLGVIVGIVENKKWIKTKDGWEYTGWRSILYNMYKENKNDKS